MAAGPAAIQVRILRNLLLSVAGFVFDLEVGREGEASDFAAEALQPAGGGVVGVGKKMVSLGIAADGDAVQGADADLFLIALPAGVEFFAQGVGTVAFDEHTFRTGAAGLAGSDGSVGGGGEGAAGERAAAEAGAGAEDGKNAAILESVEIPFAESVFGEGGWSGGQGDAAVASVFGDPDRHGVGHAGRRAHGPRAAGEGKDKGCEEKFFSHNRVCEMAHSP